MIANTVPNGADSDIDTSQANLTATVVGSGPAHAAAFTLNPDGSFSYTPTADYNGPDPFTYKLNDGSLDSNTATVNITVSAVNDAPVATNDSFTTAEDTQAHRERDQQHRSQRGGLRHRHRDQQSDRHGGGYRAGARRRVHPQSDGSFSYTPTADYNGPDSFTYKLNDGATDSNTATVSLTVTAVNDAPVAQDDGITPLRTPSSPGT